MKRPVVFTDLDGTLLDPRTYSFDAALPALDILKARHIPLVICSSKTRAEIEHYRLKFGNTDPFISENGGAVFIPKGYFSEGIEPSISFEEDEKGNYRVIRLGAQYRDLRRAVLELREAGFDIKGFGDMTTEEIVLATGLSRAEAAMAKMREFDEPFTFRGDARELEGLVNAVKGKGFDITQGLFFHILGDSDKGKAVSILIDVYRRYYGEIVPIALGDSANDIPMLLCVDHPIIVRKSNGSYDPHFARENFRCAAGMGPQGWNIAVTELLGQTQINDEDTKN